MNVPKLAMHVALSTSLALAACGAGAESPATQSLSHAIEQMGQNLGQESPSTELKLTVWLNLHNKAELDAKVKALYTPGSPSYHQWLSREDLKAYAPTQAEVAAVKAELEAHGLKVSSVDPLGLSVRFSGQTSDVERAFHTQINKYSVKGELVHTSSSEPALAGAAAGLVKNLGGLNSMRMQPHVRLAKNPKTGVQMAQKVAAGASPNGEYFTNQCFDGIGSYTVAGITDQDYSSPATMTYSGLIYGVTTGSTTPGDVGPCGYSSTDVAKIYGLDKVYAAGLTGTGQTIVIVDAYLESLAKGDADQFDTVEKLPALDSTNFAVVNPYGAYVDAYQVGTNWNVETALDVEWAHAVAPGAKIELVEAYSDDTQDLQEAVLYAVTNKLGNVITNSYGLGEIEGGILTAQIWDQINELAASEGISVQYSTGDSGDFSLATYLGEKEVSQPSDSPYATAIGGTSVAVLPNGQTFTTGWGTNINLVDEGNYILSAVDGGFDGGSGGGQSIYFDKPAYQAELTGAGRHLPDVSALADGRTGVELYYSTAPGTRYLAVGGGTSLASPIFAGMWSLLNQANGSSLGQAAPYIAAAAKTPLIQDVLPITGPANVTGSSTSKYGTFNFSADDLAEPLLIDSGQYTTAFWNLGYGTFGVLTFGADSSLNVTEGWDAVTGYGTPNMGAFAELYQALKK